MSLILGLLVPYVSANYTGHRQRRRKNRKAPIVKILHVDSRILGAGSISRRLSALAVAQWSDQHPEKTVVYRDLVSDPVDHLAGEILAVIRANTLPRYATLSPSAKTCSRNSSPQMSWSSALRCTTPEFGASSRPESTGSQSRVKRSLTLQRGRLVSPRKDVVIASPRGFYGPDSPLNAFDHREKYRNAVFNLFGITNVRFLRAE
jgi:FMN-dependent NADH-azoreductase